MARMAVDELDWWAARPAMSTRCPLALRSVQAVGWDRLLLAIQGAAARSAGRRTGCWRRKAWDATSTMSYCASLRLLKLESARLPSRTTRSSFSASRSLREALTS